MSKIIRYLASMLPVPLEFRAQLYRLSGMKVGPKSVIDRNLQVTRPDLVVIGSRVTIANAVSILGEITAVNSALEDEFGITKAAHVVIEDDVYIGVKATILPGIRVGRMATVGANTLVTADVPPYGVVVGVPGRVMMIRPYARPDVGTGATETPPPAGSPESPER